MRSVLILLLVLFSGLDVVAQMRCDSIISAMEEKWKSVNLLSYRADKTERVGDDYLSKTMFFTVQRTPFKAVLEMRDGEDSDFVLYDYKADPKNVLYIPDGFPYKNLTLDLENKWVRGENHYSLANAGFQFIINLIRNQYILLNDRINCCRETRDGVDYYCYKADAPDFKFVDYHCSEHITVKQLAAKLGVSGFLIVERNEALSAFDDDCYGLDLIVPNLYGRRIEILIHAQHMLPSFIRIEDENGMLEELNYTQFKFEPKIPADYFTEDYLEGLK